MSDQEALPIEVPDKLFFRIGEVAELVGVEPHVLRYWESEFKMRPERSPSGQRMYRRKDIAKFLKIRTLLHDEGFTIAGARKSLADGGTPRSAGNKGGGTPADASRVEEATKRLEAIRARIAGARSRFAGRGATNPEIGHHAPEPPKLDA